MSFQRISLPPEALLTAFREAAQDLLYSSETDALIIVQSVLSEETDEYFSGQDLEKLFYEEDENTSKPVNITWAEAHRADSNGTRSFFRHRLDFITTHPDNNVAFHLPVERQDALRWRRLRDLLFDNLVNMRYFRVELAEPNTAQKDIYWVGRHVEINVNPDTNELETNLLDWIVLSTYVIET